MTQNLTKFLVGIANLALLWLSWQFLWGQLDWGVALGAVLISGFWLVLTAVRLRELFQTYFDLFSRLRVRLPLTAGIVCAALALFAAAGDTTLTVVAGAELVGWLAIYIAYRYNRNRFEKLGGGPLPKDAWLNPPAAAIPNLSLILTAGNMANRIHEAVGHGETPVDMPDGRRMVFSAYMEEGVTLRPLSSVADNTTYKYIVLRLRDGVTAEQARLAQQYVQEYFDINHRWAAAANQKRLALIARLPLPAGWRAWIAGKTHITGYDWLGLFIGTRSTVRWTCIAVCLTLYERLGIKTNRYGTGLLGLGTGLLNPIKPVRFLADPAFVMLTLADKAAFERAQQAK